MRLDSVEYFMMAQAHTRKRKLNLTISTSTRRKAQRLAAEQHRSLSNLFEHLIALEYERERRPSTQPDNGGTPVV